MKRLANGALLQSNSADRWRRYRSAVFLYSIAMGWAIIILGFGPTVPLMRDDLRLSSAVSGLHGTALACGAVVAGLLSQRLVQRRGRGSVLRSSLVGLAAAVVMYAFGRVVAITVIAAFVMGICGTGAVAIQGSALADRYGSSASAALLRAHGAAATVGLASPLVIGYCARTRLGWRPGFAILAVVIMGLLVIGHRQPLPEGPKGSRCKIGEQRKWRPSWHRRDSDAGRHRLALTGLLFAIASELTLMFWGADVLARQARVSAGTAVMSMSLFVLGEACARLAAPAFLQRMTASSLLLASLVVAATGFAIFWNGTNLLLMMVALYLIGLGLGSQFPLGLARAIDYSGGQPDKTMAAASIVGGVASGLAPVGVGGLADHVGGRAAVLVLPLFFVAIGLCLFASSASLRRARPRGAVFRP